MSEVGYYVRCRTTKAIVAGVYDQLVRAFEHHVSGQTEIVHRRPCGEVNLVSY